LRGAKRRGNPESHMLSLDCFVARAPRNDGVAAVPWFTKIISVPDIR
jgi:hypothetical protein